MKKQKNSKKNNKTKGKGNRRNQVKYPGISKNKNLPSRQDYIEPEYINGVLNEKDELVIRALNDEELEFLSKFYEETISTNFLHNDKLKKLNKFKRMIIEDSVVQELKKELEKVKKTDKKRAKELKHIIKITKKQNEEVYAEKLKDLEEEMQALRDEHLLYSNKEYHKELYKENNSRNFCLFNKYKTSFRLDSINENILEHMKNKYYENGEDDMINTIEQSKWEEEEERLKRVLNLNNSDDGIDTT